MQHPSDDSEGSEANNSVGLAPDSFPTASCILLDLTDLYRWLRPTAGVDPDGLLKDHTSCLTDAFTSPKANEADCDCREGGRIGMSRE